MGRSALSGFCLSWGGVPGVGQRPRVAAKPGLTGGTPLGAGIGGSVGGEFAAGRGSGAYSGGPRGVVSERRCGTLFLVCVLARYQGSTVQVRHSRAAVTGDETRRMPLSAGMGRRGE
jgi:hypothetical protein